MDRDEYPEIELTETFNVCASMCCSACRHAQFCKNRWSAAQSRSARQRRDYGTHAHPLARPIHRTSKESLLVDSRLHKTKPGISKGTLLWAAQRGCKARGCAHGTAPSF